MTDARDAIARLRALHASATPGPWVLRAGESGDLDLVVWRCEADEHYSVADCFQSIREEDPALIAAMRNALPALLDVAEAASAIRTRHIGNHAPDTALSVGGFEELEAALAKLEAAR